MLRGLATLATLLAAALIAGCGVTLNGVTVPPDTLHKARSIAVVSVLGDTIRFRKQGLFSSDDVPFEMPEWGLDDRFAALYAEEITRSLGVTARPYHGPLQKDLLNTLYVLKGLNKRASPNWEVGAPALRAIARETNADLLAVVVREGRMDYLQMSQFMLDGLGFTSGQGLCATHAFMMLVLVDATSLEPVAGSTLWVRKDVPRWMFQRALVPNELCARAPAGTLSPKQTEILHAGMLRAVEPEAIEDTVKRLVTRP